jgi:phosphonate degradation associated HDIG domain protein
MSVKKQTAEIESVIDEVFSLYERFGHADYIGEPVSQLEHMSQSAQLAILRGSDDEVVLAAFFHDIGHICVMQQTENSMGGYGVKSHEKIGADFIRSKGFPERVAQLIESHVQAKRYLTFKYPEYYKNLSEASRKTLDYQGGKMTADEAERFERADIFEESILMRRWDEEAKEMHVPVMDMQDLKLRAKRVLSK